MSTIVPLDNISHDIPDSDTDVAPNNDVTDPNVPQSDEMDRYVEGFDNIKKALAITTNHFDLMKKAKHDQERVSILVKHVEELHSILHLVLAQIVDMNNIFSSH